MSCCCCAEEGGGGRADDDIVVVAVVLVEPLPVVTKGSSGDVLSPVDVVGAFPSLKLCGGTYPQQEGGMGKGIAMPPNRSPAAWWWYTIVVVGIMLVVICRPLLSCCCCCCCEAIIMSFSRLYFGYCFRTRCTRSSPYGLSRARSGSWWRKGSKRAGISRDGSWGLELVVVRGGSCWALGEDNVVAVDGIVVDGSGGWCISTIVSIFRPSSTARTVLRAWAYGVVLKRLDTR